MKSLVEEHLPDLVDVISQAYPAIETDDVNGISIGQPSIQQVGPRRCRSRPSPPRPTFVISRRSNVIRLMSSSLRTGQSISVFKNTTSPTDTDVRNLLSEPSALPHPGIVSPWPTHVSPSGSVPTGPKDYREKRPTLLCGTNEASGLRFPTLETENHRTHEAFVAYHRAL
jgi:hypothetical protein